MTTKITAIFLSMLMGYSAVAFAQNYDDDIYFNPSKAQKQAKTKNQKQKNNTIVIYTSDDIPAADSYSVPAGSSRSVDEYNRRGIFATTKTIKATDSITADAFTQTRKIEKFYNPSIVVSSNDEGLTEYYYAEPANINIIVNSPGYWGNPYYYNRWAWGVSYYDPFWWDSWGPSWSWSWGWNPAWSWNTWGPAWSWGHHWNWAWGPSWSWGWAPSWGWSHPTRPMRPGAVGNIRPSMSGGRPGGTGVRPGSTDGYRPGRNNNGYRQERGNVRSNRNESPFNYNQNSNSYNRNDNNNSGFRPGNNRGGSSSFGNGSMGGGSRGGFGTRGGSGGRGRH